MSAAARGGVSRRRFLLGAGAVAGAAAAGGAGFGIAGATGGGDGGGGDGGLAAAGSGGGVVPFHGVHQAGITTPAQDRLHFVALDLTTTSRADLADLLREWTLAARRMTAGQSAGPVGAVGGSPLAPPDDTGEALGLSPARLTVTVGLGPSVFGSRFGLAGRRPAALAPLPHFPGDALEPARSGGDLCIQACADDPQVAVHAVRNMVRLAHGTAQVRWSQLGFGRTSSTSTGQQTPRNLFGFKDGTANVKAEDDRTLRDHVWVAPGDGPAWMANGSYLVARRIRMTIETWDRSALREQERVIGRAKGSGAAPGRPGEFDPPDLARMDPQSHVRLAHPTTNGGAQLLRRGYSFVDGSDGLGHLDAGLFFLAYQRDPRTHFVRIQNRLAGRAGDAMNEYIRHTGSALFAIPPGVRDAADWYARELFA